MYDYNQKPDLNITPLVDVMLVLLAILMITAPVMEYEEQISLPKGSTTRQLSDVKKINILVQKDKVITINQSKYLFNTFWEDFAIYSQNLDKETPIHIRADQSLAYSDVVYILKIVKENGFFKVSLITDG
ncbi:MAG: biopolymer transporter ExbD [Arcobacteraceae bacterium]|nr:biopolymer transporter ExbD [Arcobacteraceae bacterium]